MKYLGNGITAYAQVILSIVFITGYFICLRDFIHGHITTPPEWKDTVTALISLLTGSVMSIISYWFSRQRESSEDKSP